MELQMTSVLSVSIQICQR